jgi:hypothetical protein
LNQPLWKTKKPNGDIEIALFGQTNEHPAQVCGSYLMREKSAIGTRATGGMWRGGNAKRRLPTGECKNFQTAASTGFSFGASV